jgi:hypothetical protein
MQIRATAFEWVMFGMVVLHAVIAARMVVAPQGHWRRAQERAGNHRPGQPDGSDLIGYRMQGIMGFLAFVALGIWFALAVIVH